MFEGTLLESSSARRPVLAPADWLAAIALGLLGFFLGSMKLPVVATPEGTNMLLLRAAVFGGALMFYSLSVCYAFKDARRQGLNAWLWAAVVLLTSLPGFLIYLFYSAAKTGDWKRVTLPIAYTLEVLVVAVAALLPLINIQALPNSWNITKPVPPPSRGASQPQTQPARGRPQRVRPNTITVPPIIPERVLYNVHDEKPTPPDLGPYIPGVPTGSGGGSDLILTRLVNIDPGPPPEVPKPRPNAPKRVRVSTTIEAAKLIYGPKPVYPQLAVITRVQGTVRMHALIGADGTVEQLTVLSGHPLLIPAARDTVARWRYQPTLLNGEPVEVDTEIDVIFVFND